MPGATKVNVGKSCPRVMNPWSLSDQAVSDMLVLTCPTGFSTVLSHSPPNCPSAAGNILHYQRYLLQCSVASLSSFHSV